MRGPAMVSDAVLSVEAMLANAAAAAKARKAGGGSGPQSAVEKLLAAREQPVEDIVDLSPVQKLLQAQNESQNQESYFESDDYLRLKVQQLQGQLATYATIPGLDADGSVMSGIQAEIQAIIQIQAADFAEIEAKAAASQAKADEKAAQDALAGPSPDELLAKLRGETAPEDLNNDVKDLLRNVGANVNYTA